MERDDADPSASPEPAVIRVPSRRLRARTHRLQKAPEGSELVIDGDAESHEGPGGRMQTGLMGARAIRLADQSRQMRRRFNRFPPTNFNNFPRNATSQRLFAQAEDEIGQRKLREGSEKLGCGRSGGRSSGEIEPHVERSIRHEAESPSRIVHLGRTESEVGENDIRLQAGLSTKCPQRTLDPRKGRVDCQGLTAGLPPDPLGGVRKVLGVDIEEDDPSGRTDRLGEADRMSPPPGGAVHHRLAGLGGKVVKTLAEEDRKMAVGIGRRGRRSKRISERSVRSVGVVWLRLAVDHAWIVR